MKALKFIGILLLIVVAVFFTLPLLMSDHAEVKQSIFIEAKAQTVFRQVNNLQNWRNWSPFEMGDPEMESIYEGPKSGVGCKHVWKSKEMGDGSLTILESRPYEFIQGALTMGESGTALDEWTFIEKDGGTEVTWYLKLSDLSYPFYKYFGFFAESMM
ncbi:MAG: SRPBCC family protein, partial [Ignavibacteria bacterium]|nr:SRPBCC family protein [Ignavibacteria bacterium]